jgi:AraC-like DNA-binding protein
MRYQEIQPGPAVSQFVKCYWVLEAEAPSLETQTIVPDGRPELLINLREPFQQEVKGKWCRQPHSFFVGQITSPFLVRPTGTFRTIGVRFRPDGASRLLRFPFFELTDTAVAVDDISPKLLAAIDRLRDYQSLADQLAALELILSRAVEQRNADRVISFAVTELERASGQVGVRELAEVLELSPRQFERRFLKTVGISPKLFSRMQRFQRVFRNMESANSSWVEAAITCGYYDQAHLIRDFRQFSGTTPTALLAQEFDLSRRFV